MNRIRALHKFIKFYRSLGFSRCASLRRAWSMSRYA